MFRNRNKKILKKIYCFNSSCIYITKSTQSGRRIYFNFHKNECGCFYQDKHARGKIRLNIEFLFQLKSLCDCSADHFKLFKFQCQPILCLLHSKQQIIPLLYLGYQYTVLIQCKLYANFMQANYVHKIFELARSVFPANEGLT